MNCAIHNDVPASGYCRNCGKPMCPQCTREVRGALYCEDCLAKMLAGGAAAPSAGGRGPKIEPMHPSTAVAVLLGFVPGLGAVYNGEYVKALIHVLVFGGLIAALSSDLPNAAYYAIFAIGLACFYFYMPIDAYRVAKARLMGTPQPGLVFDPPPPGSVAPGVTPGMTGGPAIPGAENFAEGAPVAGFGALAAADPGQSAGFGAGAGAVPGPSARRRPMGAFVLIALGILFLLANFGLLQTEWFAKAWPVGLIVLGVWLAWQHIQGRR